MLGHGGEQSRIAIEEQAPGINSGAVDAVLEICVASEFQEESEGVVKYLAHWLMRFGNF